MDISKIAAANTPKSKMLYHENPEKLHINTLDKHCYFIPFGKEQDPFGERENSGRFDLLKWKVELSLLRKHCGYGERFYLCPI